MKYVIEFLIARKLDGLAPGTLDQYKRELVKLANYLDIPTVKATTNDLRQYLLQFQNMSQNSIARKISTVKAFYTWLVDEEYLEKNPTRKIKTPKEAVLLPKALTKEDFDRLRFHEKSIRNQAILELLVSSGMRISEMIQLNRDDLDMNFRRIKVRGKGNKERLVHFSVIAKFCLIAYLSPRTDENPALFINRYGKRLSIRSVELQVKQMGLASGLRAKVTPHVMRHTFATNLYKNGADLGFIQDELGHARPDTTKRYAMLDEQTKMNMYDKYSAI
ncbi:MAG: tyrosine-type recombinase/integrase [Bacillota bacterium]|nr:tyrosine-type recombinase/integrase [Bacillota bacterium]